jgi:hypothetical protein
MSGSSDPVSVAAMTQERPRTPDDSPPYAPGVTHDRLADRWPGDAWRGPLLGVALGVLTLPAVTTVLVALLVLAARGEAAWLLVAGAALVTSVLGGLGAAIALRRGHRGVVHRVALLAGAWGGAVVVAAVALALASDLPDRVGVAVMLVLGGTYTLVLALALWGASRVMPVPVAPASTDVPDDDADGPAPVAAPTPTVDDVPTPAPAAASDDAAPDDAELADWPAWGGDDAPAPTVEEVVVEEVVDAEVVEPAAPPVPPTRPAEPARPARSASSRPVRPAAPHATPAPSRPPRRSVTSGGAGAPRRTGPAGGGPATERIVPEDGDGGPPTQRLPPVTP